MVGSSARTSFLRRLSQEAAKLPSAHTNSPVKVFRAMKEKFAWVILAQGLFVARLYIRWIFTSYSTADPKEGEIAAAHTAKTCKWWCLVCFAFFFLFPGGTVNTNLWDFTSTRLVSDHYSIIDTILDPNWRGRGMKCLEGIIKTSSPGQAERYTCVGDPFISSFTSLENAKFTCWTLIPHGILEFILQHLNYCF